MKRRGLRLAFQLHPRLFGGQERFLLRLLGALRERGHACFVVSAPAGRVLREFERAGFASLRLAGRDFGRDHERLATWLRLQRVDVVQTNLYAPLAGLAADAAGVPHVWRVGGHPDVALGDVTPARRLGLLRLLSSLSAEVVCNSRFVAGGLRKGGVRQPRVIPNGVPIPPAASPHVAGDPVRFALAAHFYPVKRHADFVRAAAFVARRVPARFRIYGSSFGQEQMLRHERAVRDLVQRFALGRQFDVRCTRAEGAIVAWSDVAVLPSVGESCSNAVLEAMAAGRAVVAARSGGNPELVVHGRSGRLHPPGNWRGLAAEMLALAADPRQRDRLGRAAARRVVERFSIERCASAYEALYGALAG